MLAFSFRVDERKLLEMELFPNRCKTMASRLSYDFPNPVLFKQKSEMTGDCCVFKFIWRSVPVVSTENNS